MVGGAACGRCAYLASRRTDDPELPLFSMLFPNRRPMGCSGEAEARRPPITTTLGAAASSRSVKPRPARSGISIVSQKLGETIRRLRLSALSGG
jgi:hypothetical protein